jgi:signal transduction histidine kinase
MSKVSEEQVDAQDHARSVRDLVHEFNNQLFVIGGHCELLALQLEPGSRAHADLAAILEATDRAGELASQMRALATACAAAVPTASIPDADTY